MIPFVNLKKTHSRYRKEIDQAINKIIDNGTFILGEDVQIAEDALKKFTSAPYALTCKSGTSALMLALRAINIQPGDEIITTPFTFIATGEMIAFLGAKPIFVDIDEKTYNIDPNKIEEKITPKTKAIIPVSLYGQISDMDTINDIAEKHKLVVIEDGAQSFGATYKNKLSCNLSTLATTSFFPAKPLGVLGDGGAIFTQNEEHYNSIKTIRNHGQTERYHHTVIGNNERLDSIQAAVLNVKLKYYKDDIKRRQEIAETYNKRLNIISDKIILPEIESHNTSVFAQYSIRVTNRSEIKKKLENRGIPIAIHYPTPLHLQPCFKNLGGQLGDLPITEKICNEIMSLPICCDLSTNNQDKIIESVIEILQ